jgi:hypothetical protein
MEIHFRTEGQHAQIGAGRFGDTKAQKPEEILLPCQRRIADCLAIPFREWIGLQKQAGQLDRMR